MWQQLSYQDAHGSHPYSVYTPERFPFGSPVPLKEQHQDNLFLKLKPGSIVYFVSLPAYSIPKRNNEQRTALTLPLSLLDLSITTML
jgi:hypothetical protein